MTDNQPEPETAHALQAVRNAQGFARRALGDACEAKDDLVFCRDNGTRHDPDVVSKRFVRHVKKSGVPRLHFHGLRHASIDRLLAERRSKRAREHFVSL